MGCQGGGALLCEQAMVFPGWDAHRCCRAAVAHGLELVLVADGLQAVDLTFVSLSAGSVPPASGEGWRQRCLDVQIQRE